MENSEFEKLVHIQVEIADQIICIEKDINYYENLEKELVQKRERELHKTVLGCKDQQKETEFAIHYIQVKLQQKRELYSHLAKAFRHRSQEYMRPTYQ